MLKKVDVPQTPFGSENLEYYKSLARLAERRARDIRRIAALDRDQLEKLLAEREPSGNRHDSEKERFKKTCARLQDNLRSTERELKEFRKIGEALAVSRAHRLAAAYIRFATGNSLLARALYPIRFFAHLLFPLEASERRNR